MSTVDGSIDPDIVTYYERGGERARLTAAPSLELLRTRELLARFLPAGCRVLDVGGATGVHAKWLAARGHPVHLIDPIPSHVDTACRVGGFTAEVGDARALPVPDASRDVTLLFGPLYHLLERTDRVLALREAARVTVPGGLVLGVGISRWASLFEALHTGELDTGFVDLVRSDLATGVRRGTVDLPHGFTTAYFHHPDELAAEATDAGLTGVRLYAVEGPASCVPGLAGRLGTEDGRATILDLVRRVEREPSVLGISAHVLLRANPR